MSDKEANRNWSTIGEIATRVGMARGTVWGWVRDKKLISHRAGVAHRILNSDLEKTLQRFYSDRWANVNREPRVIEKTAIPVEPDQPDEYTREEVFAYIRQNYASKEILALLFK